MEDCGRQTAPSKRTYWYRLGKTQVRRSTSLCISGTAYKDLPSFGDDKAVAGSEDQGWLGLARQRREELLHLRYNPLEDNFRVYR